jgi:RNA polymerase sigma factor (sigma-70 family)
MPKQDPTPAVPATPHTAEADSSVVLLERARAGDREAVDRLFARYLPPLQRWAHGRLPRWVRDITETSDVVQEALLQTFKRIELFEPQHDGALRAYLRQAVLNRIRDEYRRSARRPDQQDLEEDLQDAGPSPLEEAAGQQLLERYEAALGGLSPEDRDLVIGRVEMRMTYQELAELSGRPTANAARAAVTRALVKLAEAMGHDA